jgi:hypothetical protein
MTTKLLWQVDNVAEFNFWNVMRRQAFISSAYERFLRMIAANGVPAGQHCTVLRTDIVNFSASCRNEEDREEIVGASRAMMRATLGRFWDGRFIEDRGDGLLIVVPYNIPTSQVMVRLHRELPIKLREHNRVHAEPRRIKYRVAVDVGPVKSHDNGMSGEPLTSTSRLINSPVIKRPMDSPDALLGIIASSYAHERVIRQAAELAEVAATYRRVRVNVKEYKSDAWLQVISNLHVVSRPVSCRGFP